MADTIREVYQLDVTGNFEERLAEMRASVAAARTSWGSLQASFKSAGAEFRKPTQELLNLIQAGDKTAAMAEAAKVGLAGLDSQSRSLAKASNKLTQEQNNRQASLEAELKVLDLAAKKLDPRILALRGEERAVRKLTKVLVDNIAQREFERLAAAAGIDTSQAAKKAFDAEAEALKRAAKAAQELAVAKSLAEKGLDSRGRPMVQPLQGPLQKSGISLEEESRAKEQVFNEKRKLTYNEYLKQLRDEAGLLVNRGNLLGSATSQFEQVGAAANKATGFFGNFLYTFRRLVGVMAVFTVARHVVRGFSDMISGAVRFNAAIEQNRVGLAGLIAAAGDVRDISGNRLSLEEQLATAQNIAISQMGKLRVAALQTAASYQEVSTAFTQAVAPGLTAGLTLDQIRQVTVEISQAATGLGVAQNQLAEEIRSLFQGTINPRNTRIATALGITSADIARAKQVGNLFDYLQGRFAAISATGARLMNTFTGQLSNATDAFSQLLATTSKPLFEQLKSGLQDLQKSIFNVVDGEAVFSPKAKQAFEGLFSGLARGAAGIRDAFKDINIQGLGDSLGLVGEVLGGIAASLAKAFSTFFEVAAPSVSLIKLLVALFTSAVVAVTKLNDAAGGSLGTFAVLTGQITLAWITLTKLGAVMRYVKAIAFDFRLIWAGTQNTLMGVHKVTTLIGRAVLALHKNFLRTSLVIMGVAGLLTLLVKILPEDWGNKVTSGLASGLNWLTSGLDSVIDKMVTLREEATSPTDLAGGLVGDSMRTLEADIGDLREELKKTYREIRSEGSISSLVMGSSPDMAQQAKTFFDGLAAGQEKLFQASQKQLELENALGRLRERSASMPQKGAELANFSGKIAAATGKWFSESIRVRGVIADISKEYDRVRGAIPVGGDQTPVMKQLQDLQNAKKAAEKYAAVVQFNLLDGLMAAREAVIDQAALGKKMEALAGEQKVLEDGIVAAKQRQADIMQEVLHTEVLRLKAAAAVGNFESKNTLSTKQADVALQKSLLEAELAGDTRRAASAEAQNALAKTRIDLALTEARYKKDLELSDTLLTEAAKDQTAEGLEAVRLLSEQKSLKETLRDLDLEALRLSQKRAAEDLRRKQLSETGTFGQGVDQGLQDFAQANSSFFDTGRRWAEGAMNSLGEFVGSSFRSALASAFDPNQNFDLAAAIVNLGLDVASSLVTDAVKSSLAGLIPKAAATLGNTATDTAAAATTDATVKAVTATVTNTAATATNTGTIAGLIGALGALNTSIGLLIASFNAKTGSEAIGGIAGAASVAAKAFGGRIREPRGFARGGNTVRRSRPRGMDPRDTVPAMLRPGEWVIRPEAVRHYGDSLFHLLNSRRLDPSMLRGLRDPSRSAPVPKRSFATGGPVVSSVPSRRDSQVVQAIQFSDEQTMDRALASGPDSMLRFARRRRSSYRAALGID